MGKRRTLAGGAGAGVFITAVFEWAQEFGPLEHAIGYLARVNLLLVAAAGLALILYYLVAPEDAAAPEPRSMPAFYAAQKHARRIANWRHVAAIPTFVVFLIFLGSGVYESLPIQNRLTLVGEDNPSFFNVSYPDGSSDLMYTVDVRNDGPKAGVSIVEADPYATAVPEARNPNFKRIFAQEGNSEMLRLRKQIKARMDKISETNQKGLDTNPGEVVPDSMYIHLDPKQTALLGKARLMVFFAGAAIAGNNGHPNAVRKFCKVYMRDEVRELIDKCA